MSRKIFAGILFLAWIILLVILSVLPTKDTFLQQDLSEFRWDYLEHFFFYFILGFLFVLWRSDHTYTIRITEFIIFLISGFVFCWLTEYVQVFIPGRAFNIIDMGFNMAGIITGTIISYYFILRILFKVSNQSSKGMGNFI